MATKAPKVKTESKTAKKDATGEDVGSKKKGDSKKKDRGTAKGKPHRVPSWNTYLYKVLASVHPDKGMSYRARAVLTSMLDDLQARLAMEAGNLARYNHKQTLSSREIQTAVRMLFPGELAKHAVSDGTKAVAAYTKAMG